MTCIEKTLSRFGGSFKKHKNSNLFKEKNIAKTRMKKTMEDPSKIMRRSIHTFLQNYHRVTTAAAVALPSPPVSSSLSLSSLLPLPPFT